jgi:signal transduction histidine kinase
MRRRRLVIPVSIVLSIVAVALSIALLVGWTLVILKTGKVTLMVLGIISFSVIMTVVVLFTVFLVREVQEVRRQTTFIDSVTHELKSPLAAMRLCVETMARPGLEDERREELRGMMLEDVERLGAVVDGILAASRLRTRGPSDVTEFDLHEQSGRAADRIARRHGVSRDSIAVDGVSIDMRGDAVAVDAVLENLLDNALKYSGEQPRVALSVRAEGERAVIEVRDDGVGIERRDLRRIFQRFYRAPEESVRSRHGTGLGLYVVAELVRRMGGRIEAESEGLGRGSVFTVRVPTRQAA